LYEKTKPELEDDEIDVKGLKPGELYEFVVVAVDGDTMRESDIVEIEASSTGNFFYYTSFVKLIIFIDINVLSIIYL